MNGTPKNHRTVTNVLLASIAVLLLMNLWAIQSRPQAQTVGTNQESQREIAQATLEVAKSNERIATALDGVAEAIRGVKLEVPNNSGGGAAVADSGAGAATASGDAGTTENYEGTFQLGN